MMYGTPIPMGHKTIWEVPITQDMIDRAVERRKKLPVNPKNSIMSGTRTLHGLVGEEMIAPWFRHRFNTNVIISDDYNHDLIINRNILMDLKTKVMKNTGIPHHNYEVSVANANIDQQCDFYVFARIYKNFERGFYVGLQRKEKYLANAIFLEEGEPDYSNKYMVQADCWNRKIWDMDGI